MVTITYVTLGVYKCIRPACVRDVRENVPEITLPCLSVQQIAIGTIFVFNIKRDYVDTSSTRFKSIYTLVL